MKLSTHTFPHLLIFLIIGIPFLTARADRIRLKNGQYLDGLIQEETQTHVVLNFGTGTMTIKRDKIKSMEKSNSKDAEKITDDWRRKNFLHEKYVPAGLEDLASAFRNLCDRREKVTLATRQLSNQKTDEQKLQNEISSLQDRLTEVSELIKTCSPEKEVKEYNAFIAERNSLVASLDSKNIELKQKASTGHPEKNKLLNEIDTMETQIQQLDNSIKSSPAPQKREKYETLINERNSLVSEITIRQNKIAKSSDSHHRLGQQISDYFNELTSFAGLFVKRHEMYTREPQAETKTFFFNSISNSLCECNKDFSQIAVPSRPSRGSTIVSVFVNDKVMGNFILDTGASTVIISELFAKRLHLDIGNQPASKITLADGSLSPAKSVTIKSMQLGGARVEQLEAFVLPNPAAEGIDGLLGMTFLENFIISLDGNTGNLILRQFAHK